MLWVEERRGAVELLTTLAGYDQPLLRQATIGDATRTLDPAASG